jgi:hypothetical protein
LFPTLSGTGDVDFVQVAQNRHHKKPSIPLCPRLKRLFGKQRRHSFEIRTTKLKMKPVEGRAFGPSQESRGCGHHLGLAQRQADCKAAKNQYQTGNLLLQQSS